MNESTLKLWRLLFALLKLVVTLVALVLVIGGIVVYATEPLSILIPQDAFVAVLAGGSLAALMSFIAFVVIGVKKRTDGVRGARLRWIVLDALIMAALATGFIFAALLTMRQGKSLEKSEFKKTLSEYWESASPAMLTVIQSEGQCCGFGGYSDRVLEPCKRYAEAVGCWTVLRDEYAYYLHIMTPCLIILASMCFASSVLGLILLLTRLLSSKPSKSSSSDGSYDQEEPFRINRSQPFDAWHKAVFA